jgi:ATP synthase F1 subcomplex alpha subunit 
MPTIRPDEISTIIKQQIEQYNQEMQSPMWGQFCRWGMALPASTVWIR